MGRGVATMADKAAIVGIGQTDFSKQSGRTELALAVDAITAAVEDAGLERHDIDGVVKFTSDTTSELALVSALGLKNLRYYGELGYGGSAHCAVIGHAAMAVTLGLADVVVCYRALNERSGTRLGTNRTGAEAYGVNAFAEPFGMLSPAHRFAMFARRHMVEFGTTSEDFGRVAVAMREHAQRNPRAMMHGRPLTLADHQASRWIVDPLRLFDCCLESDGGVAVVVTSAERARNLRQAPCLIRAFAQGTGPDPEGIVFRPDLSVSEATHTAADLFGRAGLERGDVDVAQFYDHFSPFVLFALEAYGFCEPGEAAGFVRSGEISWPHGSLPVNTHGGNLSEAYMHGMGHVIEAVRQLRGTSTCQVADAEIALVGSAVAQVSSALLLRR